MNVSSRSAVALGAVLALVAVGAQAAGPQAGVFQYVVHKAEGKPAAIVDAVAAAAPAAGFQVLARVPVGSPAGCGYQAEVLALYLPSYGAGVVSVNRRTGPFAIVDRVNVFEDEKGVHVSVLNPRSVLRTALVDDARYATLAESHLADLRRLVTGSVKGESTQQDYGQLRDQGYIGKTMGVVAGGPFDKKVQDVAVVGGGDWRAMGERVRQALAAKGPKWGLTLAYALEVPEAEAVVLGSTGSPMDSQSFEIVAAGADAARSGLKCPGLAHAGAYPIEVVVTHEGVTTRVRLVETMYRMKMYFEDAGKWAFMKNMSMPGSLEDELTAQIRTATAAR